MQSEVVRVGEVMARLDCGLSVAYAIIRRLNAELEAKGYITVSGRVPRTYFEQKCKLADERIASKAGSSKDS